MPDMPLSPTTQDDVRATPPPAHGLLGLAMAPELDTDIEGDLDEIELKAGDSVGRYTLIEPLGKGGFGIVWKARQNDTLKREVALKIVRAGMNTKSVITRFRRERQALALMSHRFIASVLDAGATKDHRPYFAMELVHGVPITQYVRDHRLGLHQCLELMLDVCEAIQYAHVKGVLHRDLKPSNILVTESHGLPVPTVIDFGIAKILQAEAQSAESLAFTARGIMLGTPRYMAPENATLGTDQVDFRADVYSLGAILYEMLTCCPAIEIQDAESLPANELFRRMCATDPVRPSTRVLKAGNLDESTYHLALQLSDEIDWLVLKALEKSPDDRYPTVAAFADDLRRYLNKEPLSVGPPSAWYRLRKLAQRHQVGFALGSTAIGGVIVIALVSLVLLNRESRARSVAEEALQRAEQSEATALSENQKAGHLTVFLSRLLSEAGKHVDDGKNPEALRLALDESTRDLDRFDHQPEIQAALCSSLVNVYVTMGDSARALPLLKKQQALFEKLYGFEDHRTQSLSLPIAKAEIDVTGDRSAALKLLKTAADLLEKGGYGNGPDWFNNCRVMASELSYVGRHDEALAVVDQLMKRRNGRNIPASEDGRFLRTVAEVQRRAGRLDESAQTLREALEQIDPNDTSRSKRAARVTLLVASARLEVERGNLEASINSFEESIALDREHRGKDSNRLIDPLIEMSRVYARLKRVDESQASINEALRIARKTGDSVEQMHGHRAMGEMLEQAGKLVEALPHREACEIIGREHAPHPAVWMDDLGALASLQSKLGKHDQAIASALRLDELLREHPQAYAVDPGGEKQIYEKLIAIIEKAGPQARMQHQEKLRQWSQKLQQLNHPVP
ncbi:MAG: protein kinase [Verrucomicrobiaceae bacterium]|nr:protein kinase [Verrucomicrobiaceae bacterium]